MAKQWYWLKFQLLVLISYFTEAVICTLEFENMHDTGEWWVGDFYTVKVTSRRYLGNHIQLEEWVTTYELVGRGIFRGWRIMNEDRS